MLLYYINIDSIVLLVVKKNYIIDHRTKQMLNITTVKINYQ